MARRRERGHVRFHEGHWWVILPTMRREDGTSIRPWFRPDENTEEAAKALLARKLVELRENRLPVPAPDTVGEWVEEFLEHHDVEPSTLFADLVHLTRGRRPRVQGGQHRRGRQRRSLAGDPVMDGRRWIDARVRADRRRPASS